MGIKSPRLPLPSPPTHPLRLLQMGSLDPKTESVSYRHVKWFLAIHSGFFLDATRHAEYGFLPTYPLLWEPLSVLRHPIEKRHNNHVLAV